MPIDVVVPSLGESITEAVILKWFKTTGDAVEENEPLVELETEKITIEIPCPASGVLGDNLAAEGSEVEVGGVIGSIDLSSAPKASKAPLQKEVAPPVPEKAQKASANQIFNAGKGASPSAQKMAKEMQKDVSTIVGSGPHGHVLRSDLVGATVALQPTRTRTEDPRGEKNVPMSQLRRSIARRLKQAQNEAAMLTSFNEINMTPTIRLRNEYRDLFEKKHGIRLGFLGFFTKAVSKALHEIPVLNAEIYNDSIIYKNYYDIGVAVGTSQGLVVPILRNADKLNFAEIETSIKDFGKRAREGKLSMQEMTAGTFTITNGGVFGSLLSAPILNPPQSGILGMHKIEKRPVVEKNEIVIRDMMYVALSYDHRIVDGREAVTFLVRIKEMIEEPARLLLDI